MLAPKPKNMTLATRFPSDGDRPALSSELKAASFLITWGKILELHLALRCLLVLQWRPEIFRTTSKSICCCRRRSRAHSLLHRRPAPSSNIGAYNWANNVVDEKTRLSIKYKPLSTRSKQIKYAVVNCSEVPGSCSEVLFSIVFSKERIQWKKDATDRYSRRPAHVYQRRKWKE